MSTNASAPLDPALLRAVELLAQAARRALDGHPWAHLNRDRRGSLELPLTVPLRPDGTAIEEAARSLAEALAAAVDAAITHQALFPPGRVFCLRCASAECEHSAPGSDPRQIFIGFGATGLPKFLDFGQWLLERGDPEVEILFRERPGFVARVCSEEELTGIVLDAYRDRRSGYRLHGQVVAGWYPVPDDQRIRHPIALTVQVVSSRPGQNAQRKGCSGTRRRFALAVLASGPGGEPAELLYDRLGQPPWTEAVRWAQGVLEQIAAHSKGKSRRRKGQIQARIDGLLNGLARRLERSQRARGRRTQHAEERHDQKDRPTEMALADLRRAQRGDLLFDTRHETVVALGQRGRAHVFNLQGKHVTSVRYSPPAIEKRKRLGRWRPAEDAELAGLEKQLGLELTA